LYDDINNKFKRYKRQIVPAKTIMKNNS